MASQNTYFCACMGSQCKCADNLDRDIIETLTDYGPMTFFDICESVGVSAPMVRDALRDLTAQGRVKRAARLQYKIA